MNSLVSEPGRPRLTWYGQDAERIELSGAVLVNWINKTTNLLVEEFDAAPGCRVMIDLPTHWRSAIWAMAAWRTGATVVIDDAPRPAGDADVVVTARPEAFAGTTTADVVAVALPALARRFDGTLPPGVIDAAGAVMTYADQILWVQDTEAERPALVAVHQDAAGAVTETVVTHGRLLDSARAAVQATAPGARVLLDGRHAPAATLTALLGTWAVGGSAVLTSAGLAAALDADAARRDRLVTQEGVTSRA